MSLSRSSKINAYNDAILYLESEESSSDTGDDHEARLWLAKKLDKECQKYVKN